MPFSVCADTVPDAETAGKPNRLKLQTSRLPAAETKLRTVNRERLDPPPSLPAAGPLKQPLDLHHKLFHRQPSVSDQTPQRNARNLFVVRNRQRCRHALFDENDVAAGRSPNPVS
jgi:hypothetical protein